MPNKSRSCGCMRKALIASGMTTHGHVAGGKQTRMYRIFNAMHQRCTNPKNSHYASYGGRGIAVCEEWQDFLQFAEWAMANGYLDGLQIDRIDNSLGYCPSNCRWVTGAANIRNTRRNVNVTAFGETKCVTDWAADCRCVVDAETVKRRLLTLGMPPEAAITTPRLKPGPKSSK